MTPRGWWRVGLAGAGLVVLSTACLLAPGRIDIVDGQTRFEVARSLLEHGDTRIRDSRIWFGVFPGRDGASYTSYRLPQSLLGVPALLLADLTGPRDEGRRHFFYLLTSALAAAGLAVCTAGWFRHRGLSPAAALTWGIAGILCTPSLFYSTSTFDDILCAATVVAALFFADLGRQRSSGSWFVASGLMLGLAFHCKQPMAAFLFAVVGVAVDPERRFREQQGRRLVILLGLLAGMASFVAYELYKFPPGTTESHEALRQQYVSAWPGHPLAALCSLLLSPAKGMFWYFPALILGLAGLKRGSRAERWGLAASAVLFVGFLLSMSIWAGDPSWGPRYMVPLFAVVWLYAPWGARAVGRPVAIVLLTASLTVQVASVAVDPHRLYVERGVPSAFYAERPWLYFHPAISHLWNRPREIFEIAGRDSPPPLFSPAPSPTFAFPVIDRVERGPRAVKRYAVLDSFRPWWCTLRELPAESRPVVLGWALAVQLSMLALGALGVGVAMVGGSGRIAVGSRRPARAGPPR